MFYLLYPNIVFAFSLNATSERGVGPFEIWMSLTSAELDTDFADPILDINGDISFRKRPNIYPNLGVNLL